ncbi:MAG: carbohydrate ABC transporter permease [Jatrophihabitans sp.]
MFGLFTLGYGLRLSFVQWNGINPNWTEVGLRNFKELLWSDPDLSQQVRASFYRTGFVMIVLSVGLVAVSLPIAVVLNSVRRFKALLRTIYFLPYVTTGIAVFYAWRFILLPDGGLNRILDAVGLSGWTSRDGLLGTSGNALPTATAILLWSTVPLGILLYLAGLQSIDRSLVEAARVDGAGSWRLFWSVYWPLLRPTTALLVAIGLRSALHEFQVFLLMTNGGPLDSSTTTSLFSFQLAFGTNSQYGYASALGWMLFVLGIVISGLAFVVLRRRD